MTTPLIDRASGFAGRTALVDDDGSLTYDELLTTSRRVAGALLDAAQRRGLAEGDLGEMRVAYLVPATTVHPLVLWGIWRAGGIAVPLATMHPRPELEHVVADSQAALLVAHPTLADRLRPLAEARDVPLLDTAELLAPAPSAPPLPRRLDARRRALIVYTSGTTGRPKGAVTSHANLAAQIDSLVGAWEWRAEDRVLLTLPLHHVHGLVNVLGCALGSGAACEMLPAFDADRVWRALASRRLTLFMAVPTIYARLIRAWEAAPPERRRQLSAGAAGLRLMVSGSAALPVAMLERWREITGHVLLERYGMTEIGMALSNPLHGERRPGHVGQPLPGVEVRRLDERGEPAAPEAPAELEVRGPGVFLEYWNRPAETAATFRDGWFRTGDVAVVEAGSYRLLGRESVDILKTGGYKVSALEIEEVLRRHPAIAECAVVGLTDEEWGQRVAAAVELAPGGSLSLDELREWAGEELAAYKLPTRLVAVPALPRNALGKVTKPDVAALFD